MYFLHFYGTELTDLSRYHFVPDPPACCAQHSSFSSASSSCSSLWSSASVFPLGLVPASGNVWSTPYLPALPASPGKHPPLSISVPGKIKHIWGRIHCPQYPVGIQKASFIMQHFQSVGKHDLKNISLPDIMLCLSRPCCNTASLSNNGWNSECSICPVHLLPPSRRSGSAASWSKFQLLPGYTRSSRSSNGIFTIRMIF